LRKFCNDINKMAAIASYPYRGRVATGCKTVLPILGCEDSFFAATPAGLLPGLSPANAGTGKKWEKSGKKVGKKWETGAKPGATRARQGREIGRDIFAHRQITIMISIRCRY
jgi:hypothetical protein